MRGSGTRISDVFFSEDNRYEQKKKDVTSPFEEAAGALKKDLGHQGPCYT